MSEETESCYWCTHIQADSTESMSMTGWCSRHKKRVSMEQEGCENFVLYESLSRMASGEATPK